MVWKKIKSGKGKMWSWTLYHQTDKKAKMKWKIEWEPTAACKKVWKKYGQVAKKHIRYSKVKPAIIIAHFPRVPRHRLI